jgi:hypothetical protein
VINWRAVIVTALAVSFVTAVCIRTSPGAVVDNLRSAGIVAR